MDLIDINKYGVEILNQKECRGINGGDGFWHDLAYVAGYVCAKVEKAAKVVSESINQGGKAAPVQMWG